MGGSLGLGSALLDLGGGNGLLGGARPPRSVSGGTVDEPDDVGPIEDEGSRFFFVNPSKTSRSLPLSSDIVIVPRDLGGRTIPA